MFNHKSLVLIFVSNGIRRTSTNSRILTLHCGDILNRNLLFTTFCSWYREVYFNAEQTFLKEMHKIGDFLRYLECKQRTKKLTYKSTKYRKKHVFVDVRLTTLD
uniref:Uncharacterized protein n=1 Tax=Glossina pallidipes TaxID=7398 RepID=A0A1B0AEM7_GLOPL